MAFHDILCDGKSQTEATLFSVSRLIHPVISYENNRIMSSRTMKPSKKFLIYLDDADDDYDNIDFNGYKLYVNGRAVN